MRLAEERGQVGGQRIGERLPFFIVVAGFELVQALTSRRALIWDSLLDWSAVSLGAVLGWALEVGQRTI